MSTATSFQFFMALIWLGWQSICFFDLYRLVMEQWQVNRWVLAWLDGCIAGIAGIAVFRQIMQWNGGEVRFIFLLALLLGVRIYYWTTRKALHKVAGFFLNIIRAILRFCNRLLKLVCWNPLKFIIVTSSNVCARIVLFFWRKIKKNWLTKHLETS